MGVSITRKVWGVSTSVYTSATTEVHSIHANEGGFCSIHKHDHKSNMFFVAKGILMIEVWDKGFYPDQPLCDMDAHRKIIMLTTEAPEYTVPPKVYHRFTAVKDTDAIEVYWIENIKPDDIVRVTLGGVKE